jgi:predicted RNA methylase
MTWRHPPADTGFDCEADVLEGLEPFAAAELRELAGDLVRLAPAQRPGALRFRYRGDLDRLLDLRSVVAVSLVGQFELPRPKALLGHQHFTRLLDLLERARELWRPGAFPALRLSAAGAESSVLTRLRQELAEHLGISASTTAEGAGDLLLRLRRAPDGAWEALVRLSPFPLAARPWRVCNMPGALNASVAHVIARLTRPRPADRLLNLACGSGTLLIERLALGPARSAVGCDTDPRALECARANLVAAGFQDEARLEPWDATQLPLPPASVDVICADLPFGQLIGSHDQNQELYPYLLAEATRVARSGAHMALITHEIRLLEQALRQTGGAWREETSVRVRVGGMTPQIALLRRT